MCSLSSEHLLPGVGGDIELFPGHVHCETGGGSIAEGESLTVIGNPIAPVRNADARGGSIEGEANIIVGVGFGEVGELTVISRVFIDSDGVAEFKVTDGIPEPSLSE